MDDLFSYTEAQARRDAAIERVTEAAPPDWKAEAERAIRDLAATGEPFTADHVWALLEERDVPPPPEKRALGGLRSLAQQGVIVKVGMAICSRPERNSGYVAVWRGSRCV